jgi:hypothetical protein
VQQQLAAQRDSGAQGSRAAAGPEDSLSRSSTSSTGFGVSAGRGDQRRAAQRYIVFVKRNGQPTPVWVKTGLTDMDYSEVVQGLTDADSVLVLPSASLVQSQQDMRERFNRITGGGAVPGMQQQPPQTPGASRP